MTDVTYQNVSTDVNCITGGNLRVTIPAGTKTYGSDIPCRFCRIQAGASNTGSVTVTINAAYGTTYYGVVLPPFPSIVPYPIDNLSKLHFYGTQNDVVNIEYFK